MKGSIFVDYWIRCGKCLNSAPVTRTPLETAAQWARAQGWRRLAKHGWVCPACRRVTTWGDQWGLGE